MTEDQLPYRARLARGLTTLEAAQLVHVTRRTWELWESGKGTMPIAKRELFVAKLNCSRLENPELVAVFADDGHTAIDVVASDGFCSLSREQDGSYIIRSLAVHRGTNRPYVHRRRFRREHNEHVIRKVGSWQSVMDYQE